MIEWNAITSGGGKKRKFWGNSDAVADIDIVAAFGEQWEKVPAEICCTQSIADCESLSGAKRQEASPIGSSRNGWKSWESSLH